MLRKKFCNRSSTDWSNYKENFSDLLEHQQETPKRKRRIFRRKNETVPSISQEIDQASSGDDYFPVEGVQPFSNELFSSPVFRPISPNNQYPIKSTPSRSPILRGSAKKFKNKVGSLIPLSPITPGLKWDTSINKSEFSVHVQDSCHELFSRDQTSLATPLDFSDAEIEDDFTQSEPTVANDNTLTQEDENNITESEFSSQVSDNKTSINILDTTGTKWIKNVKEKIEEDWNAKSSKITECTNLDQTVSYFDSGKKDKFVKGGFAEQLNRVLKKQKDENSIFLHRIKTGKIKKQNSKSLVLKILSDQKEGLLHVIECKNVKLDSAESSYTTLILPDEFVSSLNLNLGLNLRLYPPYFSVKIDENCPLVLLNGYSIKVCETTSSGSNLLNLSHGSEQSSCELSIPITNCCESLLKCLEGRTSVEGISIVTTIQRIFCRNIKNSNRWSLLCSDAYGTFFVVEIITAGESNWNFLLKNCEGQRVIINDLSPSGRVTKSQFPALFSIINSIWCSNGHGLMHVNSSQDSETAEVLIPPSYCYFLHTEKLSTISFPQIQHERECGCKESCKKMRTEISSELNRPFNRAQLKFDVLYKPSKLFKFTEIENCDENVRFSVLCQYIGIEPKDCSSQDIFCGEHTSESNLCVCDLSNHEGHDLNITYNITVKNICFLPENLTSGCGIVFKDIFILDGCLVADSCSRIVLYDCKCEIEHVLCQELSLG